jgi:hypothetical protein
MGNPTETSGSADAGRAGDGDSGDGVPLRSTAPFVPPFWWMEAFEAQATAEMIERLLWYAARHTQAVVAVAGAASATATERVQAVLTETLEGSLAWSPANQPLEGHLIDSIRQHAWNDRASAARRNDGDGEPADPPWSRNPDQEDTAELRPVAPGAHTQRSAQKLLQALRLLVPTEQEILDLLEDAILHDEATEQMEATSTGEGQHAARNLLQWALLKIDLLRRETRSTAAGLEDPQPIAWAVPPASANREDLRSLLELTKATRARLWEIRRALGRGRR